MSEAFHGNVWAALDGRFQEVADALAEYRGDT